MDQIIFIYITKLLLCIKTSCLPNNAKTQDLVPLI